MADTLSTQSNISNKKRSDNMNNTEQKILDLLDVNQSKLEILYENQWTFEKDDLDMLIKYDGVFFPYQLVIRTKQFVVLLEPNIIPATQVYDMDFGYTYKESENNNYYIEKSFRLLQPMIDEIKQSITVCLVKERMLRPIGITPESKEYTKQAIRKWLDKNSKPKMIPRNEFTFKPLIWGEPTGYEAKQVIIDESLNHPNCKCILGEETA